MERKIRVGAVSYLNTKPLLYGIEHSPIINEIDLITEYPALIAQMLLKDEIDIGLVPVSIIPEMKEYHINTRFCIGSDGPVASVCLFSEKPIHEISTVMLDYQSRTSVALARILFKKYWKQNPEFLQSGPDFLDRISGNTAAVVIGDRALELRNKYAYIYDLGEVWKAFTGLPFVFAAWVSNKALNAEWVTRFDEANAYGLAHISDVIEQMPDSPFNLELYYRKSLSYELTEEKKKGLTFFLELLSKQ